MLKKLMIDTEGVLIGTVEKFQGREKKIIIISTVRSSPSCFYPASSYSRGLLTDKKRFNVAVTRCMALEIIIGNPYVLNKVKNSIEKTDTKGCINCIVIETVKNITKTFMRNFFVALKTVPTTTL